MTIIGRRAVDLMTGVQRDITAAGQTSKIILQKEEKMKGREVVVGEGHLIKEKEKALIDMVQQKKGRV